MCFDFIIYIYTHMCMNKVILFCFLSKIEFRIVLLCYYIVFFPRRFRLFNLCYINVNIFNSVIFNNAFETFTLHFFFSRNIQIQYYKVFHTNCRHRYFNLLSINFPMRPSEIPWHAITMYIPYRITKTTYNNIIYLSLYLLLRDERKKGYLQYFNILYRCCPIIISINFSILIFITNGWICVVLHICFKCICIYKY